MDSPPTPLPQGRGRPAGTGLAWRSLWRSRPLGPLTGVRVLPRKPLSLKGEVGPQGRVRVLPQPQRFPGRTRKHASETARKHGAALGNSRNHAATRSDAVAVIWSAAPPRRIAALTCRGAMLFLLGPLLLLFSLRRYRSIEVSCSWRTTRRRRGMVCRVRPRSATCESGESSPHSKGFAPATPTQWTPRQPLSLKGEVGPQGRVRVFRQPQRVPGRTRKHASETARKHGAALGNSRNHAAGPEVRLWR
jgi:hypothetical protein